MRYNHRINSIKVQMKYSMENTMNSSIRKETRTISRKENGQGYLDEPARYIILELSISDQFSREATAIAIVSLVVEFVSLHLFWISD